MGIMNFYLSTKLDDLYMIAAIHFVETCAIPFQDFGYLCWWACICFSLFVFWLATTVFPSTGMVDRSNTMQPLKSQLR
jgi:hypothetical protein